MTQCDRVLALLRARGDEGLNTSALQELPTLDGGKPVLRLAARIDNLKARGYTIRSSREANGTATYILISEPGGPVATTAGGTGDGPETECSTATNAASSPRPVSATPASLFDTSALTQRGASYRDAEAA